MTVGTWQVTVRPGEVQKVRSALASLPVLGCRQGGETQLVVETEGTCWDLLFQHHEMRRLPGVQGVSLLSAVEGGAES